MSLPRPARPGRVRPTRRGRFVLGVVLLSVVAVGILAMRLSNRPAASTAVQPATTHSLTPVPHSAAIEQAWGVRFSALILGGDRGMLDVRYVVVNPAKSARLHGGSVTNPDPNAAVKNLPTFIKEGGGGAIVPTSAMMHFEHFHFQTETLGSGFSILYGNAGGLLHIGDKVTIRMVDGLELKHVVVTS